MHMTVDMPAHLLALHVTPANADDRSEVGKLAEAKKGFVLLPKRWVVNDHSPG